MIRTSGWIFVVLGIAHTLLSLALVAPAHATAWFSGDLWRPAEGITAMGAATGGYWFSIGGFGIPLLAFGFTVLWTHRRGIVPPAFPGWMILAWGLVNTVILLPSPWIVGVVGAVLYLAGVRRASRTAAEPAVAQAV
jgi:hypothetical protein